MPTAQMSTPLRMLLTLNAKAVANGTTIFGGIPYPEKVHRRAVGKRQRAARKINRGR